MRRPRTSFAFRTASLGIAAAVALVLAAPHDANADDQHLRGVSIDARGVHFDFGPGYHYTHVRYPHARSYFAANKHYRKAKRRARERDDYVRQAQSYLSSGRYIDARSAFDSAIRADRQRQRQLARLDRDRERFEREHTHRRARRPHRHDRFSLVWKR
jgi:tetratricopeptide (TPR) repeat protein